ncbi:hypothetical protein DEO72_LG7g1281 [Vigna unguiculata]|uniref:Uncharacterized protein n=1 Tax=Vigna unguiculata TaxID=3917 RepID=A0A4D6MJV6_VIGUN|nr:hypothetical protein DEO72_LG7g1281 [Vigna unguiculata]
MVDNGRRWRRDDGGRISGELRCCGGCGNGGLETGSLLRCNGCWWFRSSNVYGGQRCARIWLRCTAVMARGCCSDEGEKMRGTSFAKAWWLVCGRLCWCIVVTDSDVQWRCWNVNGGCRRCR